MEHMKSSLRATAQVDLLDAPADGARREGCWFKVRKWDRVSFRKLEGTTGGAGEAE